jgi:hypothetical protein
MRVMKSAAPRADMKPEGCRPHQAAAFRLLDQDHDDQQDGDQGLPPSGTETART